MDHDSILSKDWLFIGEGPWSERDKDRDREEERKERGGERQRERPEVGRTTFQSPARAQSERPSVQDSTPSPPPPHPAGLLQFCWGLAAPNRRAQSSPQKHNPVLPPSDPFSPLGALGHPGAPHVLPLPSLLLVLVGGLCVCVCGACVRVCGCNRSCQALEGLLFLPSPVCSQLFDLLFNDGGGGFSHSMEGPGRGLRPASPSPTPPESGPHTHW